MKDLYTIIKEKLIINKNTGKDSIFTADELHNDWEEVWHSFSQSEKKPFKEKYGVNSNKKEDIMKAIAFKLRELRQKRKSNFEKEDIRDFWRLEFKDKELYDYLDEEPIDFVKYLFEYYEKDAKKRGILKWLGIIHRRDFNYHISYADKNLLVRYEQLQKYLKNKGEL